MAKVHITPKEKCINYESGRAKIINNVAQLLAREKQWQACLIISRNRPFRISERNSVNNLISENKRRKETRTTSCLIKVKHEFNGQQSYIQY